MRMNRETVIAVVGFVLVMAVGVWGVLAIAGLAGGAG